MENRFGSKYVSIPANNINNTNNSILQFSSYLFMCKLNSTEANYKVSTGTEEEKIHIQRKYKKTRQLI
jgi:hypothetical protein